jgi:hypothetical protein
MLKRITAGVCAAALSLVCVGPAAAFDCIVAKKPASAGASFDFVSGEPTKKNPGNFDKPHGAFYSFGDEGSTFSHAPDGVLPPTREGGSQQNCDGKGLDSGEACGF